MSDKDINLSANNDNIESQAQNVKLKNANQENRETTSRKTNPSFWLILFFIAGVKEILEFIGGLLPVIGSALILPISLLLGGIILTLLLIGGRLKKTKGIVVLFGHLADVIPVLNIAPFSLAILFWLYLDEKRNGKTK